jgi:hypothetical protein
MNARKMFWIVLVLSGVVMAGFATVGAGEKGLKFLGWDLFEEGRASGLVLYKMIFSKAVVGIYLTWIAAILALISTASIFPEFMTGGAIDLYLSKPIGRTRLFLTKYVAGLLFVTLQVAVFTVASFVVLGVRGHTWEPSLFLAIPIVVVFFSYLWGICVLLGVVTRSTLAALLLTLVAWLGIWAVDKVDMVVTYLGTAQPAQRYAAEQEMGRLDREIAAREGAGAATGPGGAGGAGGPAATMPGRSVFEPDLETLRAQRRAAAAMAERAEHPPAWAVHSKRAVLVLKTFVPKTRETTALLDRYLLPDWELAEARDPDAPAMVDPMRERSAWWVVGSSLGFEVICVGVGAWVFGRRDY